MSEGAGRKWMYVGIVFIIITIILAGITFYQYTNYQTQYSSIESQYTTLKSEYSDLSSKYAGLSKSYNETLIKYLAYDHWISIASKNIDSLMSQYSNNAVVYWFKGPLAGNYTMTSVMKGPTYSAPNATNIKTLWLVFFNNNPAIIKIHGFSISLTGNNAVAKAQVSFIFTSGPRAGTTLNINYELDYTYVNGNWVLYAEWWVPQ
jgi:hypothetical protein